MLLNFNSNVQLIVWYCIEAVLLFVRWYDSCVYTFSYFVFANVTVLWYAYLFGPKWSINYYYYMYSYHTCLTKVSKWWTVFPLVVGCWNNLRCIILSYDLGLLLLTLTWVNLNTLAWISNHIPSKVWVWITYPFPNFNGYTIEVWDWTSTFDTKFYNGRN